MKCDSCNRKAKYKIIDKDGEIYGIKCDEHIKLFKQILNDETDYKVVIYYCDFCKKYRYKTTRERANILCRFCNKSGTFEIMDVLPKTMRTEARNILRRLNNKQKK